MVSTRSSRALLIGLLLLGSLVSADARPWADAYRSTGLVIPSRPSSLSGVGEGPEPVERSQGQGAASSLDGREALQNAARLVQQGRLDKADELAQRGLSDPRTRAAAHSVLGAIRLQQQRLVESAEYLEEAIRLDPRLLGAHLTLAEVHALRGRPDLAAGLYTRALKLDPMNPTARFGLAHSETDQGNYRRSLELAHPVLAAFKLLPEGLIVLATNYLKTGDRVGALELVDHWTRLADIPQSWSIRFALLFAEEGVASGAIEILERAKKGGPATYGLALNLAGAYLLNGDPGKALESYDAALVLEPGALPALRQAAGIAERQGELERALSYWIRAKKIAPDDPEILLGFGGVCLKMDLLEDAEPALTRAVDLHARCRRSSER